MRAFIPVLVSVCALAALTPALAQTDLSEDPQVRQARWYEDTMADLAQALGGAHAIRLNCGSRDYALFRTMEEIIAIEDPGRRLALEGAWNEGFRLNNAMHPTCTSAALAAEQRLREQAERMADGLSATLIDPPPP
jgi:uncharacterized protein (TIGR02301 family)